VWFHSLRLSFFVTLGRCVKSFFFWAMEVLTMEVSSFVPPTNKQTNKKKQSFHWQEKGFHKCQLWQIKSPLLNGINPLLCFRSPHRRVYRSRRKTLNPEQVFFFIAGSTNSTVWSFCFFFFPLSALGPFTQRVDFLSITSSQCVVFFLSNSSSRCTG
jgi:hypothetical protein